MHRETFGSISLNNTVWIGIMGLLAILVLQIGSVLHKNADNLLIIVSLCQFIYAGFLLRREQLRRELLSPLALYSFLLILHFAIPGILIALGVLDFANTDNLAAASKAQLFVLIGFIFFHGGCSVILTSMRNEKKIEIRDIASWNSSCVKFVLLVFSSLGWLDRIYIISKNAYFQISRTTIGELSEQFHAALRLAEQLPGIAIIIIWIFLWHQRVRKYSALWWCGWMLWLAELMYWIPTGRKENVILTLLLPMMVGYLFTRRLPSYRIGVATIIIIAALFPAAFYYRSAMELGESESFLETIRSSSAVISESELVTGKSWWTILAARISLVESVSASIRIVDSGVWSPFVGRTYGWALYSIVPRVLWQEKPDFHYGTAFGHAAGILHNTDNQTSISVTYFGEAYLNFLWLGVLALFFIGIIFSLIYRCAFIGGSRMTWIFLYIMTLPVILYIGGTFALYFSGLFQNLVIFSAVAHFMSGRTGPSAANTQGRLS